jgi:hypothetical protein
MQKSCIYVVALALIAANSFTATSAEPSKASGTAPASQPVKPVTSSGPVPPLAFSKGLYLGENRSEQTIRSRFGSGSSTEALKK